MTTQQEPTEHFKPSVSFYGRQLSNTRLKNCTSVKDYLEQMHFWRDGFQQHGGIIDEAKFTQDILHGLTDATEFRHFQGFYAVLKKADAVQEVTLHEVISRLQAFELGLGVRSRTRDRDLARTVEEMRKWQAREGFDWA